MRYILSRDTPQGTLSASESNEDVLYSPTRQALVVVIVGTKYAPTRMTRSKVRSVEGCIESYAAAISVQYVKISHPMSLPRRAVSITEGSKPWVIYRPWTRPGGVGVSPGTGQKLTGGSALVAEYGSN